MHWVIKIGDRYLAKEGYPGLLCRTRANAWRFDSPPHGQAERMRLDMAWPARVMRVTPKLTAGHERLGA